MGGIEKEIAREREKRQEGRWGGQREKKQTSNNVTYMQSHTPFFLLLVTMCTFLRREGARGGRKREGERERKEEGGAF